jgi:DUF971 family protein
MAEQESPVPTEINLHKKPHLLEIAFSDGAGFRFPFEYLCVFSSTAGEPVTDKPLHGKERVAIEKIEPQGNSQLQLQFNDGHTGRFSEKTSGYFI